MNIVKLFQNQNTVVKLYVIISLLIMFSGSTFIKGYHRYLLIMYAFCVFCMAYTKQGRGKGYRIRQKKLLVPFLIFFTFTVFLMSQYSYAYVKSMVATYVIRFAIMSVFLLFVPSSNSSFCLIRVIKLYSFFVAGSIIAITLISGHKSGGLVGNYQYAGMLMSVAGIVYLIDYFENTKDKYNMIGILLCITGLMISGKRMFSLIFVLAFWVIFMLSDNNRKYRKFAIGVILAAVFVMILIRFVPSAQEVFNRITSRAGDIQTATSGRNVLWEKALITFKSNKIHGIGFGAFQIYFDNNYTIKGIEAFLTHNIYIGLLAETGLVGFCLFVIFLFVNVRLTIDIRRVVINSGTSVMIKVWKYSLLMQIWFILYGFTGNGIYDVTEMFIYMSAVAMAIALRYEIRRNNIDNVVYAGD